MTQVIPQIPKTLVTTGGLAAPRIAFIQARWHAEIVDQARLGFLDEISRLGLPKACVDSFDVPGAFEIPLHAQTLARTGRYGAVVAAGLVVDGGVYRHDFVAQAVINGLMEVQLASGTPVFSVVLTPHHFRDSAPQSAFFHDHFEVKGREAAAACIQTLESLGRLRAAGAVAGLELTDVG